MTRKAKGIRWKPGVNVAAKSGLNRALIDAGFGHQADLNAALVIRRRAQLAVMKSELHPAEDAGRTARCAASAHTTIKESSWVRQRRCVA